MWGHYSKENLQVWTLNPRTELIFNIDRAWQALLGTHGECEMQSKCIQSKEESRRGSLIVSSDEMYGLPWIWSLSFSALLWFLLNSEGFLGINTWKQLLKKNGYPDPSLGDKHIFLSSRRTVSRVPYGAEKSLKTFSFETNQFGFASRARWGGQKTLLGVEGLKCWVGVGINFRWNLHAKVCADSYHWTRFIWRKAVLRGWKKGYTPLPGSLGSRNSGIYVSALWLRLDSQQL